MTFSGFMKSTSVSTTKASPTVTHSNFSFNRDILIFNCLCMTFYPFQEDPNSVMFSWTRSSARSLPSIIEVDVISSFYVSIYIHIQHKNFQNNNFF
jgi:hypothetical protein